MFVTLESANSVIAFLRQLSLFSGLGDEALARLIALGKEIALSPGDVLIREGEPGDSMYVILSGEFEVVKQAGSSEVVIAQRGSGEVIGEIALLDDAPRSATVRALEPSQLLVIHRDSFHKLLEWSPAASVAILKTVTSRLRNTQAMLQQSEKMAALGTLSAGVAHELNNPAAAVGRAAEQLRAELREVERLESDFVALPLAPAQRAAFTHWRAEIDARGHQTTRLDPLARADLEYEVQEWLEARGVDNAWEIAPRLVSLGFDRARLEELAAQFTTEQLPNVLSWLAGRGNVEALLDEIASSAGRISNIVKAIKSYSYLDQAAVQEVDVHVGLDDTLTILRHKLKQGVTVKRDYARDLPKIEAYASELNQVWTNIIDNAIDAMKGQGELTIRTYHEPERVCVEICDNGPGIPPEVQPRIFDAFFTTKPVGSGTGLGLHISYNIVVLKHHGQITVQSRPGETCFKVTLPERIKTTTDHPHNERPAEQRPADERETSGASQPSHVDSLRSQTAEQG